jgi:hypothetical protein
MESQGVYQAVESGGKPLVEVGGVFLVGMATFFYLRLCE